VAVFAKSVDHGEDDRFAANARQCLNEIQPDVRPDRRGYRERQEQAGRVQVFRLVALAGGAGADVILDGATETRRVEVPAEAMQRALDALVAVVVNGGDQLVKERRRRRD